jgi:hypothetical protein
MSWSQIPAKPHLESIPSHVFGDKIRDKATGIKNNRFENIKTER